VVRLKPTAIIKKKAILCICIGGCFRYLGTFPTTLTY
jgi:hypothetical protein